ncbi:hypothetical protein ASPBRDRAFT_124486 [Aspergillus brasiliensis CBS 101740]|uniref:Uncharacterized protein n=1 Tax=Aspergillus brasiliensis (strain CBS 101740 / IMI 381727 / IBT 21946) TaxID=767769 RepID=A0A1L9UKZ3_ASPBC|nr:hypothetical protein ASPBRDRAFT_124486 [Aspergillus brasiliensis CBS 101740]
MTSESNTAQDCSNSHSLSAQSSIDASLFEIYRQHLAYLDRQAEQEKDEDNGMVFPMDLDEGPSCEVSTANAIDNRNEGTGGHGPTVNRGEITNLSMTDSSENRPDSGIDVTTSPSIQLPPGVNTEPFPEYYKSCETAEAHEDKQVEEAYNLAIAKVCEEVIRFRQIDSLATEPLSFTMDDGNAGESTATSGAGIPNIESPVIPASHLSSGSSIIEHSEAGAESHLLVPEERKKNALEEMRAMIGSDHMKPPTRTRFVAMCNIILRLEFLFFRRHITPVDPISALISDEVEEINYHIDELMKYLGTIDRILRQELTWARRVEHSVKYIAEDTQYDVVTRFKNMAQVIINHLNKPRPSERRLLTVFLNFYDAYLYTDIISDYNRQLPVEENWNPVRVELTHRFVGIWDIINRTIESYEAIIKVTMDIKGKYTEPCFREMQEAPEIWRTAMIEHHIGAARERERHAVYQAEAREIAREHARILAEEERRKEEKRREVEEAETEIGSDVEVGGTGAGGTTMDAQVHVQDFAMQTSNVSEGSGVIVSQNTEDSEMTEA